MNIKEWKAIHERLARIRGEVRGYAAGWLFVSRLQANCHHASPEAIGGEVK